MFNVNRDTLAALIAIAAKDDDRLWLNAIYFYRDNCKFHGASVNNSFCASILLGSCVAEFRDFGIPVFALEVAVYAAKKAKIRNITISPGLIVCGTEIVFHCLEWGSTPFNELLRPGQTAVIGPNSGLYSASFVAKIADLIGASDVLEKWRPVKITTDYNRGAGYVDQGGVKACIMPVRV